MSGTRSRSSRRCGSGWRTFPPSTTRRSNASPTCSPSSPPRSTNRTPDLGGKLRELRFRLGDAHQRITYWLAPGRRVVLLTVFRKTKMREQAEVDRAHAAQRWCEAEHEAAAEHDLYTRDLKENR